MLMIFSKFFQAALLDLIESYFDHNLILLNDRFTIK